MKIHDIVERCEVGTEIYSYRFGLNKMKLIGKCMQDHTAFVYEGNIKRSSLLPDYYDGYFLKPEEAVDYAIDNCRKQIERMNKEIERLNAERRKL